MNVIKINFENVRPFFTDDELTAIKTETTGKYKELLNLTGKGSNFLGWLDLPSDISKEDMYKIEETALYLRRKSNIIVVVGIGGSYLGARAIIDALQHSHKTLLKKKRKYPLVVFAGHNLGEDYLADLIEILDRAKYSVIVISKSGTTTEPAVAFRILKEHIEKKFTKEIAARRIVAITDGERGALKKLADREGYKTFVIPDDVGGRYSVLSPVGLLPIACSGFNITEFVKGAEEMETFLKGNPDFDLNPAMIYAALRNLLYRKGKTIEIFSSFIPSLFYFIEWWKQLFGESEGKEGKGVFPAGAIFSTDLHSMGQYIQEGKRNIFETNLWVENPNRRLTIPDDDEDLDEINYLSGNNIHFVNEKAMLGTMQAHLEGGVPNLTISVPLLSERNLGALVYFFEFSCALSGYILGVNPFDQPGVEAYKKNMFKLLGK